MEKTVSGWRVARVQGEWEWMPWFWRPGLEAAWDKVGKVGWTHREKPIRHATSSSLVSEKRQTAWEGEAMSCLGESYIACLLPWVMLTLLLPAFSASLFLSSRVFPVTLHFQRPFTMSWWGREEIPWLARSNNWGSKVHKELCTLKVLAKTGFP